MTFHTKEKLNYLDSIRGIAALTVFIFHFHASFYIEHTAISTSNIIDILVMKLFFQGNYAVCIFFVLSGFVLSYNYFKAFDFEFLCKQSIKRFPRLFLPILATSLMYWLVKHLDLYQNLEVAKLTKYEFFRNFWIETFTFKQLIFRCAYDLLFFNDISFCNAINKNLWTMPIELKYSFLLFFLIFFMRKWQVVLGVNIIIMAILIFYPNFISIYFLAFLLGINLSFLYIKTALKIPNKITLLALSIGLLLPCIPLFASSYIVRIISASLVLFACLYNTNLKKALNNSYLQYLGKISFSLYLIHSLVLGTISSYIFLFMFEKTNTEIAYIISLLITIPTTIIISDIVYRLIDKPSIIISDYAYTITKKIYLSIFSKTEK